MPSSKAKKRGRRRERRKAKASGWMKGRKSSMSKVGHGPTGSVNVRLHTKTR